MSLKPIQIENALSNKSNFQWVDVRSESEFEKAHFPGAINIPLLSNEHRILVGTCYKQQGREEAVSLGLELVGSKMQSLFRQYREIESLGKPILFYCWRGGLRSQISSTIYGWGGFNPSILVGGYKSFRTWAHKQFERQLSVKILGGKTGSGKTEILYLLKDKGIQIIDLEGLASHKGSAFGGLGLPPQPSTEMFENNLALQLSEINENEPVIFENESLLIGKCCLPSKLWSQMQNAPIIEIKVDSLTRVNRLIQEYAHFDRDHLEEKTLVLQKKLGGQHAQEAVQYLHEGNYAKWIEKLLVYYDKTYQYSVEKNTHRSTDMDFHWEDKNNCVNTIISKI